MSRRALQVGTAVAAAGLGLAVGIVAPALGDSVRVTTLETEGRVVGLQQQGGVLSFEPTDGSQAVPGAASPPTQGYELSGVHWTVGRDSNDWHEGTPTCVREGGYVLMGVVHTDASKHGPGRSLVAWLRCLD